jgi:hypothetical protein
MAPPETVEFAMYVYVRRSVYAMRTALLVLSYGGLSPVPRWSRRVLCLFFSNVFFKRSESSRMNRFHHKLVAPCSHCARADKCVKWQPQLTTGRRTGRQRSDDVAPVRCSRVGAGFGSRITRSTLCQGGRCVLPWFASRGASPWHGGCYAIPSLLFAPRPVPTLLAVAEAKHGRVCGDVVNSTLLMRRSVDFGVTWSAPYFPYRPWAPLRKWGQPQMVFDNDTSTAILLFSNETLSGSPGSVQVSACHGPLFQPSRESIGRRCTVSLDWALACTGQPTQSLCLHPSPAHGLIGLATTRSCCPALTSDHISHDSRVTPSCPQSSRAL